MSRQDSKRLTHLSLFSFVLDLPCAKHKPDQKSLCAQKWIKDLSLYIFFYCQKELSMSRQGLKKKKNKKKQKGTEGEKKRLKNNNNKKINFILKFWGFFV